MNKIVFLLLFVTFAIRMQAQKINVNSLKQALETAKTDTSRHQLLVKLCSYYEQIKPDSVVFYASQMIALANVNGNVRIKADGYNWFGYEQYILGNYPLGLQMLFKSLDLYETINDSINIANTHNAIGNNYKEYESFNKAKKHYLQCLKIATLINDEADMLYSNGNLGFVYLQLAMLDSALFYEQQAYQLDLKLKTDQAGSIYRNLGAIQSGLDNKNLALSYLNMSSELEMARGRSRYLCMTYMELAKFYHKYEIADSALYYAKQSLAVAKELPYPKGIVRAGKFLSSFYEANKQADSAFYYQKLFVSVNDSINSKERNESVNNISFEEQLRQQEKEQLVKQQQEERLKNIQFALITLGIVSFIIIFLLLSRSFITNTKMIEFLGVIALLIVFEFLNLLLHPFLERITHHSPVLMLLALVCIAALLVPLHHKVEHWATHKLVEKNKAIRLAAAKKTIEKLGES